MGVECGKGKREVMRGGGGGGDDTIIIYQTHSLHAIQSTVHIQETLFSKTTKQPPICGGQLGWAINQSLTNSICGLADAA